MTYRLSSTLSGHEQDVKSLANTTIDSNPVLISVSRDSTTRVWNNPNITSNDSTIIFNSPSKAFINSTAVIERENGEKLIASGGQDAIIYLSDLNDNFDQDSKYQLIGHQGNVCAMNFKNNELISSSWDGTAIVWNLNEFIPKYILKKHESSVWDCKIIEKDKYITASADKTIKLWHGDHVVREFIGHSDVVRKLLVLPGSNQFVSSSNDGTIKIWDLNTGSNIATLVGHDSFVYDLALLSNGNLVSTGEDRTVRVWDLNARKVSQVITLPCISVWCVTTFQQGNDFAVGGSDNLIRTFTQDPERIASESEIKKFIEAVQSSSISEQSLDDLKKTDIPGIDVLQKPGKNEGSTIMVKTNDGTIEAHQWSGGEWHKIGDVVGGASKSGKKQEYQGKMYDYVFDVDIKDGEPPLKLPYNLNENPYVVAEKFLADNELPSSYTEEVVQFLEKNTEGAKLDENVAPTTQTGEPQRTIDPYSDAYVREQRKSKTLSVIPEKAFILFKEFKKDSIINGLKKLNANQTKDKFVDDDIQHINDLLSDLSSQDAVEIISDYALQIIANWDVNSKLIGFDLLRLSIPKVTAVDFLHEKSPTETINNEIIAGLTAIGPSNSALLMMVLKVLSNFINSAGFIQAYMDPVGTNSSLYQYNEIFEEILKLILNKCNIIDTTNKLYSSAIVSLATFIYNLSVVQLKTTGLKVRSEESAKPILQLINSVGSQIIGSSNEAAYRLLIAYGNFKFSEAYGKNSKAPEWLNKALENYGNETRFQTLKTDLENIF
ncbi:DOA1 [Candida pseudojiufengensis]|uniref:DOA1 n=1 Tax=Candida pseudojiufengensis TaxID=497109 RepID=UPI0022243D8F|nr:DOA1 [Candida pseudojiufengensis]KAI5963526.1 DOA1 [Candida pseudojiufengensis]